MAFSPPILDSKDVLASPISLEKPEPIVDHISMQIYCFEGHVTLRAGLRKLDVKRHLECALLYPSDGYVSMYLFNTDIYPVLTCIKSLGNNWMKNNCKYLLSSYYMPGTVLITLYI